MEAAGMAGLGGVQVGLRPDLEITRQRLAGKPQYVIHDPVAFHNHAFEADEYRVLCAITDQRALGDTFRSLVADDILGEDDEERFFKFVLSLHQKSLLALPLADGSRRYDRWQKGQDARSKGKLAKLLYWKTPIWRPDPFLERTVRRVRWLFTTPALWVWGVTLAVTIWQLSGRFDELWGGMSSLLGMSNLPLLWLTLVGLKAVHELGHAYCCKALGGEVPEIGVALIVGTPCAYVDASASWKFERPSRRVSVALAGMYVESIVACMAAWVWLLSPEGLARDAAQNVIVLASVVTVLFNINPLVRFDGYYVLSDLTGVPNLRQRASWQLNRWAKRVFLGLKDPHGRLTTVWHKQLYAAYGIGSFFYKVVLAFSITGMVMLQWPAVGTVLGVCFGFLLVVQPVLKLMMWLLRSEDLAPLRLRAQLVALGLLVVPVAALPSLPVTMQVVAPAVLEPVANHELRAPADGFVDALLEPPGSPVAAESAVLQLRDPELELLIAERRTERAAVAAALHAAAGVDPGEAARERTRLEWLDAELRDLDLRKARLLVRAEGQGQVSLPDGDPTGSFVRAGDVVAAIHGGESRLRVILPESELLRAQLQVGAEAEVRWSTAPSRTVEAHVVGIHPVLSRTDIPESLTVLGGGPIYGAASEGGMVADQPQVTLFLKTVEAPPVDASGITARVRFPGRIEFLGGWLRRTLYGFYQRWRLG